MGIERITTKEKIFLEITYIIQTLETLYLSVEQGKTSVVLSFKGLCNSKLVKENAIRKPNISCIKFFVHIFIYVYIF